MALIAYTCDDLQPTTAWRYVDIAKLKDFIENAMKDVDENLLTNDWHV